MYGGGGGGGGERTQWWRRTNSVGAANKVSGGDGVRGQQIAIIIIFKTKSVISELNFDKNYNN